MLKSQDQGRGISHISNKRHLAFYEGQNCWRNNNIGPIRLGRSFIARACVLFESVGSAMDFGHQVVLIKPF